MYQLHTPYTGTQLAKELFHIAGNTFSKKKQTYLNHLSEYFKWHMEKSKYVLDAEIKPYETLKEKNSKEKKMEYYKQRTDTIIAAEPYNSGSNVARNIQQNNKYKVQTDTVSRYVRTILKGFYISFDSRWSKPSEDRLHYIPLTNEELQYLHSLFQSKSNNELNYTYCAEYEAGNITKEEFLELLGNAVLIDYNEIMLMFQDKYGYRPIKTKKFEMREQSPENASNQAQNG